MTALSADYTRQQEGSGPMPGVLKSKMTGSTTYYMGSLICTDTATGYDVVGATSTTLVPLGVYVEAAVTNSGASGAKEVDVVPGIFRFANSAEADALAVTDRGAKCYIVDDNTVAKTDGTGTRSEAGIVIDVDAAGVWVCVGPYPVPGSTYVTLTGTQTLTNKTLTTPTVAATGFTNANHAHAAANSGGQLSGATCFATAVSVANGGTNLSSYTAGDLIYATGATTLAKLGIGTANQVLTVNAGATAPEWANMLDPDLKGVIEIALGDIYDADGDRAKFVNGGADGVTIADSKAVCYRINNDASPPKNLCGFVVPADADVTANMTLKFLVSKSGATEADATTITVEAFNQVAGALHDADADYGGTTNALVGNAAAKTCSVLSLTLALANLPAVGSGVSLTFHPTDGTLGNDDLLIHRIWVEYTKKLDA
jgi:hypothetical protein